jgi:cell division protein FtsB
MWDPGGRESGQGDLARLLRRLLPPRFRRRYRERATFRRQVRRSLAWGAVAVLSYAFLFAEGGLASIAWRVARIRQLSREVAELERREAWLERELALRQDDRERIERLARERYGMAYPGEKIYRIVEVSEAEARRIEHRQHVLQEEEAPAAADASTSEEPGRRPTVQRRSR